MNIKVIGFIKNLSYTITSNLITLIISTLVILIIPKLIGVEEYGYWQLYLFYSSYVGFLHFGWNDGIYLRIGGEEYEKLDKKLFFSQFIELLILQIVIASFFLGLIFLLKLNNDRSFILRMVAIAMVITNIRLMLLYILQSTNRIKDYARIAIVDRIIYILLISCFLLLGIRDYKIMIIADLLGKLLSLFMAMVACKEIVFNKLTLFYSTMNEIILNIRIGIKLMIANIASALIIGVIRFGIERTWDVTTFGKVSLTLSISSMMMIFINAVGIIIFPILRRTSPDRLPRIYMTIRDFLMFILLGVLIMYYPLKSLMGSWLPQYSESMLYMALVFPIFIYEGKTALLINTYFKTLRLEKIMLRINVITMMISIVFTYVSTQIFQNLDMTIMNIVILLIIRSLSAELYLSNKLNVSVKKDIILEVLMTSIFILSGWFVNSWVTMAIYVLSYWIYLFIKKSDFNGTVQNIKLLIKVKED